MCDVEALTRGEDESQDNKWTPTAYNQECCVRWETVVVNGVNQRVCVDHKTRSGVSCLSGSSKCTPVAACPEGQCLFFSVDYLIKQSTKFFLIILRTMKTKLSFSIFTFFAICILLSGCSQNRSGLKASDHNLTKISIEYQDPTPLNKFIENLNSATLQFNIIYNILSNNKLLRILSCQKFHLSQCCK